MISVDIQGNDGNCNELSLRNTIYHTCPISYVYANKARMMHYEQLLYMDIYDIECMSTQES